MEQMQLEKQILLEQWIVLKILFLEEIFVMIKIKKHQNIAAGALELIPNNTLTEIKPVSFYIKFIEQRVTYRVFFFSRFR